MRRVLLIATLLLCVGHVAYAGEVELKKLEAQRVQAAMTLKTLNAEYQQKIGKVDSLKKSTGFNRDRKVKDALADAQEVSKKLEAQQKTIANLDARITAEKKALGIGAPPVKKMHLADEQVDPLDDPEDLAEKAKRLQASENELTREIQAMENRGARYRTIAGMRKSKSRSEDPIFNGDGPKGPRSPKGQTKVSGDFASGAESPQDDQNGAGGAGASPPPATPGTGADGAFDPGTTTGGGDRTETTLVIIYQDVVDTGTIDALKASAASKDPEARAKAAEQAAKDLKKRLEKLQKQREQIQNRAKQLRRSE